MKNRVIEIIDKKKLTPSRFADSIGVPRSTISHIISGRNKPSLELVSKIADCFPEINLDWLVKGKGSMFNTQTSLFDDNADVAKKKEVAENTSKSNSAGQKLYTETRDEDEIKYGNFEKDSNIKKEPQKSAVGTEKGGHDVSKVIIVYSDDSFEVLNPRK